jgi:adenylate kinase family enzyme
MRRIVILGCSGGGKSTFARALGERLGLAVVHIDALFWEPNWTEPNNEAFRARLSTAIAGDAWITDGNFVGRTFDLRLPRADAVILIAQPRLLCLYRALKRWIVDRGKRRPDLADGCYENFDLDFLAWIWTFERRARPRIEAAVSAYGKTLITLKGDRGMRDFLAALPERS